MLKGLFILDDFQLIYRNVHQQIRQYVDIYAEPQTKESIEKNPTLLEEADVMFSGWGCPMLDKRFLAEAKNLKAVFYGAGSIKHIVTDAFWERGIQITSAYAANAVPVVEFTLAQILFSLKRGWYYVMKTKLDCEFPEKEEVPGTYGSTIGIVSLGMIGKKVCQILKQFDVHVIAYDPYVSKGEAKALGVELCSLQDVFRNSDVISLHAPWLKETEGLINGPLIASMRANATLINTSRGAVMNEHDLINVLQMRPDIYAVLDVTHPEPPIEGSVLYTLDNVILTPHIAGSLSRECYRMGEFMLEELKLYMDKKPLQWEITKEQSIIMG
ncbi:hydroxyacid dehydrogenase [Halalkalibacter kiskunsagensis]|uniref:Hydroxyacid dehydrogenase n=1 Tax=Halalkalibacter kiskunsagensis TaxID=1548599 RepID=A0ABV6KJA5_9BACI